MKIRLVLILVSSLFLCVSTFAQKASKGRIDARAYDFERTKPFALSGQWEFYWDQLLEPSDTFDVSEAVLLPVPGSWHRYTNHPPLGVATYRLQVYIDTTQHDLLLYFPIVNASAKVWLNGSLVLEHGKVRKQLKEYRPKLGSFLIAIPEGKEKMEIVVQVANFSYFSGGIAATPVLDKASNHLTRINKINGVENFFAGSLIAMFIYQLILFLLYDKGKPYLWLGLICLGVALRALIVHGGSFLLPTLFESVPWEVWKKLEFGSVYAIVSFFPLYIYHLFAKHAPRWPLMFLVGLSSTLCIAVITTPQYTYGNLLEICHIGLLLAFVYAVYSITKAWRSGEEDARIILWGVLASFPFILLEILKNSRLYPVDIGFMYLVELGVLVFLLFQVYLLSNHYAKAYKNLEIIVEERTSQLSTANAVKDRLLSVVSHDIKSPLNSLRGILQLYNRGAISNEEFGMFTQQVEGDLNKTGMLVENILLWTNSQLKGIQVHVESFSLYALVQENFILLQTMAAKKKVTLAHNVPSDISIKADRNILNLVLRNVLSNALKFSNEGGSIQLFQRVDAADITLVVKDSGVGMDQETILQLLQASTTVSKVGTGQEQGTGLGLALCREYLSKAGGTMSIKSELGRGSEFIISLPVPEE